MEKTEALLQYFRQMVDWMQIQAEDYEKGNTQHFIGDTDDSAAAARRLRHKANNMMTVLDSWRRLSGED